MIEEGADAPGFELPAVIDGEQTTVSLDEQLGEGVAVLAFYPGDFNPACTDEATGLDELDLFQMQKDVSVLAISTDSIFSHRAFAAEYDLRIPLLADVRGAAAAEYGVAVADEQAGYGTHRAVVVVDHTGVVEYTWHSEDVTDVPPSEEIREAVEGVGGTEVARARYRVGHAHYMEGRRAFTSAMSEFESREWTLAQGDFQQAETEFETAAEEFDTAVRFAEDDQAQTYYERATEKANALWQAAEWLTDSASAFVSGEGAAGESMRSDARAPLETAREIHEPPDPDNFPPAEDPAASEEGSFLPGEDEGPPASLEMERDTERESADGETDRDATTKQGNEPTGTGESTAEDTGTERPETAAVGESEGQTERTASTADTEASEEGTEIDEEELEEITAELEEQSEEIEQRRESEEINESAEETETQHTGSLSESSPATLEPEGSGGTASQQELAADSTEPLDAEQPDTLDTAQSETIDLTEPSEETPESDDETSESGNERAEPDGDVTEHGETLEPEADDPETADAAEDDPETSNSGEDEE